MKPEKMPYVVYADTESLIQKIDGCVNNPENSLKTKIGKHIPCGYSMSTTWAFDHIGNEHTLFSRKRLHKKVLQFFKRTYKNIIDFENKTMLRFTKEELKSYQDAKVCYICGKTILKKLSKSTNYQKV